MMTGRTMRFSTLVKKYGPVRRADQMSEADWLSARDRGCYATVYHSDSNWGEPLLAIVRRDGFVNTICKIAWQTPLPPDVETIVGMKNNIDAWKICLHDEGDEDEEEL